MLVVKEGKTDVEDNKSATCSNCSCEFKYVDKYLKYINDRNELLKYVECPYCSKRIFLNWLKQRVWKH